VIAVETEAVCDDIVFAVIKVINEDRFLGHAPPSPGPRIGVRLRKPRSRKICRKVDAKSAPCREGADSLGSVTSGR